jgi:hypothetical protein
MERNLAKVFFFFFVVVVIFELNVVFFGGGGSGGVGVDSRLRQFEGFVDCVSPDL